MATIRDIGVSVARRAPFLRSPGKWLYSLGGSARHARGRLGQLATLMQSMPKDLYAAVGMPSATSGPLELFKSPDAVHWHYSSIKYRRRPTYVRDPFVFTDQNGNPAPYDGYYWLFHTSSTVTGSSFALAYSSDLVHWRFSQYISCAAITGPSGYCWAPKGYMDDGGRMHIIVSLGDASTPMQPYEMHPLTLDPGGAWSTPVILGMTGLPGSMIDAVIVRDGTTTRRLFYKNDTTKFIEEATSTSDFTGYTPLYAGNWAGWGGAPVGAGWESPSVIKIGSTWYIYMTNAGAGSITMYSTTDDITAANWSRLASTIQTPFNLQAQQVFKLPDEM
jgi:beta-xylosidase